MAPILKRIVEILIF